MDNFLDYIVILIIAIFFWQLALCVAILMAGSYVNDAIVLKVNMDKLREVKGAKTKRINTNKTLSKSFELNKEGMKTK